MREVGMGLTGAGYGLNIFEKILVLYLSELLQIKNADKVWKFPVFISISGPFAVLPRGYGHGC